MKTQFTLLIVCVVAIVALPEWFGNGQNELTQQTEQGTDLQNRNEGSTDEANDDDELIDSRDETNTLSSSNGTATEKSGLDWISRRHNRRNFLKHGQRRREINRNELSNDERPIVSILYLPRKEALQSEGNLHPRYHQRHHHHKNRTTTTTPSSINLSSDLDE